MTDTIISVRPIVITAQSFTDGEQLFETAADHCAWGIFATGPNTNIAGTAASRQAAIDAATSLAASHGWTVSYIAPEVGETEKVDSAVGATDRIISIGRRPVSVKGHVIDEAGVDRVIVCDPISSHLVEIMQGGEAKLARIYWNEHEAEASVRELTRTVSEVEEVVRYIGPTTPGSGSSH